MTAKKLYGVITGGRLVDVSHSKRALMRRRPTRIVYHVEHLLGAAFKTERVARHVNGRAYVAIDIIETYRIGNIAAGPEHTTIGRRHIGKQLSYTKPEAA